MEGTPENISINEVIIAMERVSDVTNVHHVHIWQLDEHRNALEAHVVITNYNQTEKIKTELKETLLQGFAIAHSTLEFEIKNCEE